MTIDYETFLYFNKKTRVWFKRYRLLRCASLGLKDEASLKLVDDLLMNDEEYNLDRKEMEKRHNQKIIDLKKKYIQKYIAEGRL